MLMKSRCTAFLKSRVSSPITVRHFNSANNSKQPGHISDAANDQLRCCMTSQLTLYMYQL